MKVCITCKQGKPVTSYYLERSRPDGRHPKCSDCARIYQQEYRASRKAEHGATIRRRKAAVKQLIDNHREEYEQLLKGLQ